MSKMQLKQTAKTTEQYRSLDISKSEIRLVSFENAAAYGPLRLNLLYASLNDWKPDYVSFRNQHSSMNSSQLSEAWGDRLAASKHEMKDTVTRFTWGDYICLSYTWGGDYAAQQATIFLDGIARAVSKHLEVALRDLQGGPECQLGMKVWVDALCINQADIVDQNSHVLRMKNIFGEAFSVTAWTKEHDDLQVLGPSRPGEHLTLCETVLRQYGRKVLEELLGVRIRDWRAEDDEDEKLMELVEDVDVLTFDQYHWADSENEDELGFGGQHLHDLVSVELWQMFRKEYWSRLWIIQELVVSPITSTVYWGESVFQLSTLQAVGDILLTYSESRQSSKSEIWKELKPGLDLLALITQWRALEITPGDMERSLTDTFIQELKLLAQRADCLSPLDKVYGLLGLFPASVSCALKVDYSREPVDVVAEFALAVPLWDG